MSDQASPTPTPATAPQPAKPSSLKSRVRRPGGLKVFSLLSGVTIFIAFLVAIAELLSLVFIKTLSLPSVLIRIYALSFAVGVLLVEMEWFKAVRESIFVTSWVVRGVTYVFIGTLVYETRPEGNLTKTENKFVEVASTALSVIGIVYVLLGVLFVKRFRDGLLAKYRTMLAHAEMSDALRQETALLDTQTSRV